MIAAVPFGDRRYWAILSSHYLVALWIKAIEIIMSVVLRSLNHLHIVHWVFRDVGERSDPIPGPAETVLIVGAVVFLKGGRWLVLVLLFRQEMRCPGRERLRGPFGEPTLFKIGSAPSPSVLGRQTKIDLQAIVFAEGQLGAMGVSYKICFRDAGNPP
jgi:hypothetical protein